MGKDHLWKMAAIDRKRATGVAIVVSTVVVMARRRELKQSADILGQCRSFASADCNRDRTVV